VARISSGFETTGVTQAVTVIYEALEERSDV
jgi:hypothetical protein